MKGDQYEKREIIIDGKYEVEERQGEIWDFNKNGTVKIKTDTSELSGTYNTNKWGMIRIKLTQEIIYNQDILEQTDIINNIEKNFILYYDETFNSLSYEDWLENEKSGQNIWYNLNRIEE